MTIKDVITKALLPMSAMVFWLWMVKTIMGVTGNTNLFMFLFLAGLPFGIHKMCIILIPKGMDVGGTLGMIALSVIVGGLLGSLMIPYYIVRAVYVTIREDQPVNLCGAFERAVPRSTQGYAEPSKAALAQYAQQMYSSFAEAPAQSFTVGSGLEALAPAQTAKAMLDALEKAVRDALAGNEVG